MEMETVDGLYGLRRDGADTFSLFYLPRCLPFATTPLPHAAWFLRALPGSPDSHITFICRAWFLPLDGSRTVRGVYVYCPSHAHNTLRVRVGILHYTYSPLPPYTATAHRALVSVPFGTVPRVCRTVLPHRSSKPTLPLRATITWRSGAALPLFHHPVPTICCSVNVGHWLCCHTPTTPHTVARTTYPSPHTYRFHLVPAPSLFTVGRWPAHGALVRTPLPPALPVTYLTAPSSSATGAGWRALCLPYRACGWLHLHYGSSACQPHWEGSSRLEGKPSPHHRTSGCTGGEDGQAA